MVVGPVWDHQAAGSNPVTRTKNSSEINDFRGFFFAYHYIFCFLSYKIYLQHSIGSSAVLKK